MNTPDDKKRLRQRLLRQRAAMPPQERSRRSAALQARLLAHLAQRTETQLAAYWPIRGEFDPLPAVRQWLAGDARRRAALPLAHKATHTLTFRRWQPGAAMAADDYGIPIPAAGEAMLPALLLVPRVGFAPHGVRLGWGGGFYDRTLAALAARGARPFALGLAFASSAAPQLVRDAHDVPLEAILTDEGFA